MEAPSNTALSDLTVPFTTIKFCEKPGTDPINAKVYSIIGHIHLNNLRQLFIIAFRFLIILFHFQQSRQYHDELPVKGIRLVHGEEVIMYFI